MSQVGLNMSQESTKRPPAPKRSKVAVFVALIVAVALIAAAGLLAYTMIFAKKADYAGDGHGEVMIFIAKGESIVEIGDTLANNNVVKTPGAFVDAASHDNRARSIQGGYYKMKLEMSSESALDIVSDPKNIAKGTVVVPEGARATTVIATAAGATGIPLAEFEKVLKDPKGIGLPAYAGNSAEGFLFPATYQFGPDATATKVLSTMVTKFREVSARIDLEARAAAAGRNPYDVVKVASIEEREGYENYFSKIATVIYNRLATKEVLGMDSTVNYGLGTSDLWLTAEQKRVNTPYNTFDRQGLPPTPISNPGELALVAALEPAVGDWIYFLWIPGTKEMRFSDNEEQFEKDKLDMRAAFEQQKSAATP